MNHYEDRRDERRARLERKAETARAESDRRRGEAHRMGEMMGGQPILVGHHSERRHRRDIEKMHNHDRKASEAYTASKDYERQAAAVGSGGISSDDPEAVAKLRAQLEALERDRKRAKALNAHFRKHKTAAGFEGLSEEGAARIDAKMAHQNEPGAGWVSDKHKVFPGYYFQNTGSNIRRIKDRIASLEREAERREGPAAEAVKGEGWSYEEDAEDNRLLFYFDAKPPRETCQFMRRAGFKWSPTRTAWVRQLTNAARQGARWVAEALEAGTIAA